MSGAEVVLCCFLWARPGEETGLTDYETRVLALYPEHGGEVLQRVRTDGSDGRPHEIHVFRFASQSAIESYMNDPRRLALAEERDRVVARTEVFPAQLL